MASGVCKICGDSARKLDVPEVTGCPANKQIDSQVGKSNLERFDGVEVRVYLRCLVSPMGLSSLSADTHHGSIQLCPDLRTLGKDLLVCARFGIPGF